MAFRFIRLNKVGHAGVAICPRAALGSAALQIAFFADHLQVGTIHAGKNDQRSQYMKPVHRRIATIALVMILLALLVTRCVPEKEVDLSSKITPVRWIDEDRILVRVGNDYFIRTENGTLLPSSFDEVKAASSTPLKWQIVGSGIYSEDVFKGDTLVKTERYIEIDGRKHLIRKPYWGGRFQGFNPGFPQGEYIDVHSYLHLGRVGLVTWRNGLAVKTELPLLNEKNVSSPGLKRDNSGGNFLAFQTGCLRDDPDGICTRTAWWLSPDLEVISSFLLPADDPLFTQEKLACFSCGCGCYTQEDVYAVNGKAFFLYSGFPIKRSRRGLYKVVESGDGRSEWIHIIKGRIEPPLSFSPSGCRVAYFRVSRFGDKFETRDLC